MASIYALAYIKQIALIFFENILDLFCVTSAWIIFLIPQIVFNSSKLMLLKEIKASNIAGIAVCAVFLLLFTVITSYAVISKMLDGMRAIEKGTIVATGTLVEIKKRNVIIVNNHSKNLAPEKNAFKVDKIPENLELHSNICITYFNNRIAPHKNGVRNAVGIWTVDETPTFKTTFPCPAKYRLIFRLLYIAVVVIAALILTELLKYILIAIAISQS